MIAGPDLRARWTEIIPAPICRRPYYEANYLPGQLDACPVGRGFLARGIYAGNFRRKRFAIGPNCAIFEIFLLPDGNGAFEGVDEPAASVKGRRAMGGRRNHQHACLADLQPPQPVNQGYVANLELLQRLLGQRFHLLEGHSLIGLVVEIERPAPARLVAHHAFEEYGCAIFAALEVGQNLLRVNRLADYRRVAPASRRLSGKRPARGLARSSADRR